MPFAQTMPRPCRGRFAPTPSGPLHFGSLVAAVASYADARSRGGAWCLRIDDLDPPRVAPDAASGILRALDALGMEWDGPVVYQSRRADAYHAALHRLRTLGIVYPCGCSRRDIAQAGIAGAESRVYPGTCRGGLAGRRARALRARVDDARPVAFEDAVQGRIVQDVPRSVGDFVLYRADRVYAYHLAVVVDDAEEGITHVVRGADLLDSTPRQILLQTWLDLRTPHYAHVPVATGATGAKLSKQTLATAIDVSVPGIAVAAALRFLGQEEPPAECRDDLQAVWQWALARWNLARVPRSQHLPARSGTSAK